MVRRMKTLLALAVSMLLATPVLAEEAGFAERFAARNPLTLAVLASEFPSDLTLLEVRLRAIETLGQGDLIAGAAAFNAVGEIRKKYAPRIRFAPPEALASLLQATASFHEAVFAGEGPAACGLFAQNGTGTLFQLSLSDKYAAEIDRQSALFLEAVVAAIERPEAYGPTGEQDFATLLAVMGRAGVPASYGVAIASGRPENDELCPALATMFKAAAAFDAPQGLRVRADLAQNLAGY